MTAIIRRMDLDADGKITFREFSHGITPEYPGVASSVTTDKNLVENLKVSTKGNTVDFNVERKLELKR